jgi:hypothetical protein
MKRSEMLSKIERWLDKTYPDSWIYNDVAAKELLDMVESDMYPPQVQSTCEDPAFEAYMGNVDIPHNFKLGWDDEDIDAKF